MTTLHGWHTFLHVPKSGGSSVTAFFDHKGCHHWYTPHTRYGPNHFVTIHEALNDVHRPNALVYLSLRDPAARAISNYLWSFETREGHESAMPPREWVKGWSPLLSAAYNKTTTYEYYFQGTDLDDPRVHVWCDNAEGGIERSARELHDRLCARDASTAAAVAAFPRMRSSNPNKNSSLSHGYAIDPALRAAFAAAWPEEHRIYGHFCLPFMPPPPPSPSPSIAVDELVARLARIEKRLEALERG